MVLDIFFKPIAELFFFNNYKMVDAERIFRMPQNIELYICPGCTFLNLISIFIRS